MENGRNSLLYGFVWIGVYWLFLNKNFVTTYMNWQFRGFMG